VTAVVLMIFELLDGMERCRVDQEHTDPSPGSLRALRDESKCGGEQAPPRAFAEMPLSNASGKWPMRKAKLSRALFPKERRIGMLCVTLRQNAIHNSYRYARRSAHTKDRGSSACGIGSGGGRGGTRGDSVRGCAPRHSLDDCRESSRNSAQDRRTGKTCQAVMRSQKREEESERRFVLATRNAK
jgi:hypothetical protein